MLRRKIFISLICILWVFRAALIFMQSVDFVRGLRRHTPLCICTVL